MLRIEHGVVSHKVVRTAKGRQRGSNPGRGIQNFLRLYNPSLLFDVYRAFFHEIERPEREVDYSPPSIAEVKNEWSHNYTPPRTFFYMGSNDSTQGRYCKQRLASNLLLVFH